MDGVLAVVTWVNHALWGFLAVVVTCALVLPDEAIENPDILPYRHMFHVLYEQRVFYTPSDCLLRNKERP